MFTRGEILGEFRESTSKKRIYRKPQYKKFLERRPVEGVVSRKRLPKGTMSLASRTVKVTVLHFHVPDELKQLVAKFTGKREKLSKAA